jgi:hypothetical protein
MPPGCMAGRCLPPQPTLPRLTYLERIREVVREELRKLLEAL